MIEKRLLKEIEEYCSINELDVPEYINRLLKKGFMEDKYGTAPPFMQAREETKKPMHQEDREIKVMGVVEEKENPVIKEEPVIEKAQNTQPKNRKRKLV